MGTATVWTWVREDVVAAAEWLVTLPLQSGEPDAAVDAFARAVLPQNADYASAWSFSVTDKGRRWRLMEHIGRTMIKESPDAAREYINLTDLPAASKAKLLARSVGPAHANVMFSSPASRMLAIRSTAMSLAMMDV